MQDFSPPYGEIEDIAPGIRRITANNPAPFTFKGTGTYIIGHGEVAIIDPGPNMPDHIEAILSALKGETISHILITHNHKDHSPAAHPLANICGAKVFGFNTANQKISDDDIEEGIDKTFKPDINLSDGDNINGKDWTIETVHTPGHLSNHLCFSFKEKKALFTGDHVMGWSTTIVSPPDGSMQDYLDSLEKLLERDDKIYYPTHGLPIEKPKQFIRQLIGHRLRRDKEILRALESGPLSIESLVKEIYVTIDTKLYPAATRTIYAHLLRLIDLSKVTCQGQPTEQSLYSFK